MMACAVAITAVALLQLFDPADWRARIGVDSSLESLLPADGPALGLYRNVRDEFVGDDILIVVWLGNDLFTVDALAALKRVTERVEKLPGVAAVDSLANATYVRANDEFTDISPFLATLPATDAAALSLRRDALANPVFLDNFVARDGAGVTLAVHFTPDLAPDALAPLVEEIAAVSRAEAGSVEQFVTGPIVARLETGETLFSDFRRVFPLAVVLTLIASMIGLRSLSGVVLPLAVNAIALMATMAIFVQLGYALNFVTVIMPPVVFVVGFAYAVHVVSDFERAVADGAEKNAAVDHALQEVFVPLTLTAFTTCVGFLSLATSDIGSIKVFGVFSALGTVLCWLGAVVLVPAGLRLLPLRGMASYNQAWVGVYAAKLARFNRENRQDIFIGATIVAVFSLLFAGTINVGTDYLSNFPEGSSIRRNFDLVGERFGGAVPLQIVINTDVRNAFKNPAELRELNALQNWVVDQPEVGSVVSLVDYMRMLYRTFVPDAGSEDFIPESFNLSDQLLALGAGGDLKRFANARFTSTLMHVRSTAVNSRDLDDLVARIEDRLAQLSPHLRGRVTGSSVLLAQSMDAVTRGQVISLAGAVVVIYLVLSTLFGSLRVGAVALLPNILPIIMFFGILGLTGITLNLATSLVATVALGIAVDDSIHYFSRFNQESRRLANEELGVERALRAVVRPVILTTGALCAGFLALLISDLRNQVEFGLLAATTLALACVIDLTLSPALSSGLRFVTLWEVLTLDLGSEPHEKIPLFRGLTHREARIAALFGRIEEYGPGERIIRIGASGNEFCILIEGFVVTTLPGPAGDRVIHALHPGEVFGEVALFTGTRSANIDTMTTVRVLWLNQESLERIRTRYPRIAALMFWNLSDTLAGRLAEITARV